MLSPVWQAWKATVRWSFESSSTATVVNQGGAAVFCASVSISNSTGMETLVQVSYTPSHFPRFGANLCSQVQQMFSFDIYSGLQKHSPLTNNATFRWITNYVETFSKLTFLFTTEEITLNIVRVGGGYMSGITAKSMYKSKFTGCKSIQPLRSVHGGITFCSNHCDESFWVGLHQLCTVKPSNSM